MGGQGERRDGNVRPALAQDGPQVRGHRHGQRGVGRPGDPAAHAHGGQVEAGAVPQPWRQRRGDRHRALAGPVAQQLPDLLAVPGRRRAVGDHQDHPPPVRSRDVAGIHHPAAGIGHVGVRLRRQVPLLYPPEGAAVLQEQGELLHGVLPHLHGQVRVDDEEHLEPPLGQGAHHGQEFVVAGVGVDGRGQVQAGAAAVREGAHEGPQGAPQFDAVGQGTARRDDDRGVVDAALGLVGEALVQAVRAVVRDLVPLVRRVRRPVPLRRRGGGLRPRPVRCRGRRGRACGIGRLGAGDPHLLRQVDAGRGQPQQVRQEHRIVAVRWQDTDDDESVQYVPERIRHRSGSSAGM